MGAWIRRVWAALRARPWVFGVSGAGASVVVITVVSLVAGSTSSVPMSSVAESETPTVTPTPTQTEAPPPPPPPAPAVKDTTAPKGADFIIDAPAKELNYTPPAESGFTYVRPNMVNVTAADFPSWISYNTAYDHERDNETEETWNSSLYGWYNTKYGSTYQYQPIEAHTHWWGAPTDGLEHDEIVNYIADRDALTVNFVVSAGRVTDMLPLTWMATTTGYRNPWAWKMEIDPRLTDDVYKTVGALMYIVENKNRQLRNEPIRLHKEFAETDCADIDRPLVRLWVERFASGEYDIATGQPAVSLPSPSSVAPSPTTSSSTATSSSSAT